VKLVNSPRELVDDVFSDDPAFAAFNGQRLNPGNIRIVRSIVTPAVVPPPDCTIPPTVPVQGLPGEGLLPFTPKNCDTAVFVGPRADYDVVANANGTITVFHRAGAARGFGPDNEGTDTLRNIEQLQFADTTITPPVFGTTALVPDVVGLTQPSAAFRIAFAGLTVGAITFTNSATVPAGSVITQTPVANTLVGVGSAVALVISQGGLAPPVGATTVVTHTSTVGPLGLTRIITSPPIATAANTLLVAFVSANAQANALVNPNVLSMSNTGAALTWTRAARSSVLPGTAGEVWWAFTTPAHASMTVAAQVTGTVTNPSMAVMALTGAAPTLVGAATATAGATAGAPAATLVTTRDSSLVVGFGTDLTGAQVMTPVSADQAIVYQANPGGGTYWVQQSGPAGVAGTTITFSDTYGPPMPDAWGLTLIEIRRP
jgi:hypothetical protein